MVAVTLESPLLLGQRTLSSGDTLRIFRALSETAANMLDSVSGEVDVNPLLDRWTSELLHEVFQFTGRMSAQTDNPLFSPGLFITLNCSLDLDNGVWLPLALVAQFQPKEQAEEVHLRISVLDLDEVDAFMEVNP
jgi:hypothetical protein